MENIILDIINKLDINKIEFLKIYRDINKDVLYKSEIHGIYHSEKVLLFSYLLAKEFNLSKDDLKIICDAAKYHDIGRTCDTEDVWHGKRSSDMIHEVVDYEDKKELSLLKAVVEGHSRKDADKDRNFDDYFWEYEQLEESYKERYNILYDILKDADALDRARLIGTGAALNEDYLRIEQSKKYIDLAESINDRYIEYFENNPKLEELNSGIGTCYHGFGLDFFKLQSILNNGILSYREMKKLGIDGTKNFPGGNCRNYVSCVVEDLVKESEPLNTSAYKSFTLNSINIKTKNTKWFEAHKDDNLPMALVKGRPYKKADYFDERFVRNKIDTEDFDSIFLTKELADKKIKDGTYIMPSLNYNIILKRVAYYLLNTNSVETDELIYVLNEYKKILEEYKNQNNLGDIEKIVLEESKKLQPLIGKIIADYYAKELIKDPNEINVKEVLEYELTKNNYEVSYNEEQNNLTYKIKQKIKN